MDHEYMKGLSDHIRVNLPATPEDETTGNGEGCWALVTSEVKAAYDSNETGNSARNKTKTRYRGRQRRQKHPRDTHKSKKGRCA